MCNMINQLPLCACGCGRVVSKLGNKYIHGHYWGGKVGPNKNKKFSEKHIQNLKKSRKNRKIEPMKGKHHSEKSKQKIGNFFRGRKIGNFSKEHCQKLRESKITWKTPYNREGIPLYERDAPQLSFCEEVRKNKQDFNILEVRCAYCGKWYIPKIYEVINRIKAINGKIKGEERFYCSEKCKRECPIYHQKEYPKGFHGKQDTSREVQPELRQLVFKRDKYICQKCGSTESLHCHHITGVELNPIESADIDNCITLCKFCHHWVHAQKGCKYTDFRRKVCK